jgi:hypothetical protein
MAEECVVRKAFEYRFRVASRWKAVVKIPLSIVDFNL